MESATRNNAFLLQSPRFAMRSLSTPELDYFLVATLPLTLASSTFSVGEVIEAAGGFQILAFSISSEAFLRKLCNRCLPNTPNSP